MKHLALLLVAALALVPHLGQGASSTPLGFLPEGPGESYGFDVSADGSVVVGGAFGAGYEAFRWSDGSLVGLGRLSPSYGGFPSGHLSGDCADHSLAARIRAGRARVRETAPRCLTPERSWTYPLRMSAT